MIRKNKPSNNCSIKINNIYSYKILNMYKILLLLLFVIPFMGFDSSSDEQTAKNTSSQLDYDDIIDREVEWLLEQQVDMPSQNSDGAILMFHSSDGKSKVNPYFANFAALGILARPEYDWEVKMYMDWYFRHLNLPDYNGINGSVYDYYVYDDGSEEIVILNGKYRYDSVDSYAATFLMLLKKYYEVTLDSNYLLDNREFIEIIANAIVEIQQSDGLSWAMPDYPVKYLMDNCEVFEGFVAIEWITRNVFNDEQRADYWVERKEAVANGMENQLWQNDKNMYKYYYYFNGTTQWSTFYPDATAQLFPIANGLLDPNNERAIHLYNSFNQYHSEWQVLNTGDAYPWAIITYQASIMKDTTNVNIFFNTITERFLDRGNPYPWYCAEAGHTIRAAEKMIEITTKISQYDDIPSNYQLYQNHPNPFNPSTEINFYILVTGNTSLVVYNVLGQKVATLVNQELSAGSYKYKFDASGLTSGIYFYKIQSRDFTESRKMIFLK